jgi:hypothetical protein
VVVCCCIFHSHFDILALFQAKIAGNPEFGSMGSRDKWDAMDTSQRLLTLQMAMKVGFIQVGDLYLLPHRSYLSFAYVTLTYPRQLGGMHVLPLRIKQG